MLRGFVLSVALSGSAWANNSGDMLAKVRSLAGCYVVDYSYSEIKSLSDGYNVDLRVYDVKKFVVHELLQVTEESDTSVRIQHFMQAVTPEGQVVFKMRHHGETWEYNAPSYFRYEGRFAGNSDRWQKVDAENPAWVRKVWNLDDGLRYQCPGSWKAGYAYPTFECSAFSPIPGRETRDMGRKDYNTLQRKSSVQIFPAAFLERQNNIKTVFENGGRQPLAEEVGKIWSSRVPEARCGQLKSWALERQPFWDLLASVWTDIREDRTYIHEVKRVDGSTLGDKISKLLADNYEGLSEDPSRTQVVRSALSSAITSHLE